VEKDKLYERVKWPCWLYTEIPLSVPVQRLEIPPYEAADYLQKVRKFFGI